VHDDGGRAEALGRLAGPLQLGPRVGRPDPLGEQQARSWIARIGMAKRSASPRSASGSWLTGSVQTITSTPSKPSSAAISNAVVHVSG
jgi:hypothetical protein